MSHDEIGQTFADLKWQGRLEYVSGRSDILLDVAHNVSGMRTLINYLKTNHSGEKIMFAVGWTQNHELIPAFKESPIEDALFLPIQMNNERSLSALTVFDSLKSSELLTHLPITVEMLVDFCMTEKLPQHDLLVVAGSLYLVGEFLAEWDVKVVQN